MNSHRHQARRRGHTLLTALIAVTACLTASSCMRGEKYNMSVVIPSEGWMTTDTLRLTLDVGDSGLWLQDSTAYTLSIGVRHTPDYPLATLPLKLFVQQADSLGNPCRTLYRQYVDVPLMTEGRWTGRSWGSMIEGQYVVQPLTMTFPSPGTYSLLLVSASPLDGPLRGLVSLSVAMHAAQ